jgi:glucose-6-phosphate isomerase
VKRVKKNSLSKFQEFYFEFPRLGMAIDLRWIDIDTEFFKAQSGRIQRALSQMSELEAGGIANPDENRMVGHYWLRNPPLSPTLEIRSEIKETINIIKFFASEVHSGKIRGELGRFSNCLVIGTGGSALGAQFFSDALGNYKTEKLKFFSLDNTDPNGIDRTFSLLYGELGKTPCLVRSKSWKTRETRNCMIEAKTHYERAGLNFNKHSVAITETVSELHNYAVNNTWLKTFHIWNWVGGRTSAFSSVGLLPAAFQGIDFMKLIEGACSCDNQTRADIVTTNRPMLLAIGWFHECNGNGKKNQFIVPYKDRLLLLPRYIQQRVMESLGKNLTQKAFA